MLSNTALDEFLELGNFCRVSARMIQHDHGSMLNEKRADDEIKINQSSRAIAFPDDPEL